MLTALAILCAAVAFVVMTRSSSPGRDGDPLIGAALAKAGLVPLAGTRLGAWVQATTTADDARAAVRAREELAGRPFDVVHSFHPFAEPFPTELDRWAASGERTLLLSWNGTPAEAILDGSHDDLIRTRARELRDLGVAIYLRFWWEMNSQVKAAWAEPEQFVDAWRYVRRIFGEEGADRVAWVWCPTSEAFAPPDGGGEPVADRWWPGAGWVDWVCADGYNFAPVIRGAKYRTFDQIFAPFHRWARRSAKPMMIAEFGALERSPGEKAAWLADVATALAGPYDDVAALVYFDSRRIIDGRVRDWRIDTTTETTEAFEALGTDLKRDLKDR
ncbi:MAG: glycosyl hydrolase [Acidimicrobiales bacterium]